MIKHVKTALLTGAVAMLMTVGSAKAVLWGDTVESKIDVIDSVVDVIDATIVSNDSMLDIIEGVVVSNDSMLDVMDSKLDIIDQELSILDLSINSGTTFLTSADIVGGNIDLASSGNYAFAEELTTDMTITASCITLDLNDLCMTGTMIISGDNVTVKNGTLLPPAGAGGGTAITAVSNRTKISNLTIRGTDAVVGGQAGKDGIEVAGNDWLVENCTIITGAGSGASARGGHGISLLAAANNILIRNCLISTGDGGSADPGSDGGNGINVNGSTDVEIADCTIFKTGAGGTSGASTGGDGGQGIFIDNSSTDISVHNCIIRNTGAGGGGAPAGVGGKAIDDNVAVGAAESIIFGNFAHNIANALKYDLQAGGVETGFALSNPPSSTAVSVYANVYI